MNDCIDMGGTASLFTMNATHGLGACTGAIDGTAYGAPMGEMKELEPGVYELMLYHWFLHKDGSAIYTQDREILRFDAATNTFGMEVEYTVMESSGRFEGYRGTFRGRGSFGARSIDGLSEEHSVGAIRFEGKLCREQRP
jgi:hypothetical protein